MENLMQELLGWMEAVYGAAAHSHWSGVHRVVAELPAAEAIDRVASMIDNLHAQAELMELR